MALKPWSVSPKDKKLTFWGKVKKNQLYQNYPNPFNPETWIPYQLSKSAEVTFFIYNSYGKLVRTIPLGYRQAGTYLTKDRAVYWDGKNNEGETVSSGIYFYTISAGDFVDFNKMLLLR